MRNERIACASVYAVHPDIFVLDEPSSNLDPASIQQLKDVLLKLKAEGKTLVISEHRLYYLLDIADRFIWLDQAKFAPYIPEKRFLHSAGTDFGHGTAGAGLEAGGSEDSAFETS